MISPCINQRTGQPKISFGTRAQAKVKLRSLKATPQHVGDDLHVYRCPECDWLHIGHDRLKSWMN